MKENESSSSAAATAVAAMTETKSLASSTRTTTTVPSSMSEALEWEDPVLALHLLSQHSQRLAQEKAAALHQQVQQFSMKLPDLILSLNDENGNDDNNNNNNNTILSQHPIYAAMACADSIDHSLTKIASGGSQASQEIRLLEEEKRDLEIHANAVERALQFRQNSHKAMQAMQQTTTTSSQQQQQEQLLVVAAQAIQPWLEWQKEHEKWLQKMQDHNDEDEDAKDEKKKKKKKYNPANQTRQLEYETCRAYAGEYCLKQLASTHAQLRDNLLQQYEQAVQATDLARLGQLTPILSLVHLEHDAVRLYLQFLRHLLQQSLRQQQKAAAVPQQQQQSQGSHHNTTTPPPPPPPPPPFVTLGRIYNAAVTCLRHHLPMVSHFLYKADGDAAVIQLVHVEVEEAVLPVLQQYKKDRQLAAVSRHAQQIYAALEERFTGRSVVDESENYDDQDDCGFAVSIGSLSDADAAMEEAALCIQHTESYLRFVQHSCREVNKARKLRFEKERKQRLLEMTGRSMANDVDDDDDDNEVVYKYLEILPQSTPLSLALVELGGQYAGIERCLLLASMQRAFCASDDADPKYYRPLGLPSAGAGRSPLKALQTSVVDSCFYATRHAAQRAFATGHTGTASAMTNFCSDCLTGVLMEVLSQRASESGVARLKPGEGLLVGSAGLFNNASNLIRQGTNVSGVVGVAHSHGRDEMVRKQRVDKELAQACAMLNDLEVAVHHSRQLEGLLDDAITKGFPQDQHDTETLRMCVKSLSTVTDSFTMASDSAVESLESVLKPRLRSIVGEAVGSEGSTFMGSSVMAVGGAKTSDRVMVRMNYNLDEETYNLLQVSEGYVARLCTLLDELLEPLRNHLAPRLWDTVLLTVLGTVAKRLETSIRKCQFTALGSLMLDSDVRDLLSYTKDRFYSTEYSSSNVAVTRACPALSRLLQIAKLISVDDLDDVLDLISSAKRKGNWDLKLDDAKALLSLRVEFEGSRVNELLRLSDED